MIFVEGFRLLFVLAGSAAGFEIGRHTSSNPHGPVIGLLLGAAVTYVLGGVAGRLADRGLQHAVFLFRNTPPGEIFAASIISTTGMLLGLVTFYLDWTGRYRGDFMLTAFYLFLACVVVMIATSLAFHEPLKAGAELLVWDNWREPLRDQTGRGGLGSYRMPAASILAVFVVLYILFR